MAVSPFFMEAVCMYYLTCSAIKNQNGASGKVARLCERGAVVSSWFLFFLNH